VQPKGTDHNYLTFWF